MNLGKPLREEPMLVPEEEPVPEQAPVKEPAAPDPEKVPA